MKKNVLNVVIPANKDRFYPVFTDENLLENAQEYVQKYSEAKKFLVVTDETVYEMYKNKLNLENCYFLVLKPGEESKNFDNYKKILDKALELKLERKDAIVAFGGGVVGDIAGFAAACYLRGVDFIQIPTTLLAQVDSSVGGKVAINHEAGKNLIGAFYQPCLVLSDISTLKTLDEKQLKTGLAEVLKYGFIEKTCLCGLNGEDFLKFLAERKKDILSLQSDVICEIVNYCCRLKACVVEKDEKEQGLRAVLNYGHTFAHAIEKVTGYKTFTHGEAVAIGMKMSLQLSFLLNYIDEKYFDFGVGLIDDFGLNYSLSANISEAEIFDSMKSDKKVQNNKLRFVLSNGYAQAGIFSDVEPALVQRVIKSYVETK